MFYPLGWSPDGSQVYAVVTNSGRIVRIKATGGEATIVSESPFDSGQTIKRGHMTPDGNNFVLEVSETRSDVWLVEHFDPEVP